MLKHIIYYLLSLFSLLLVALTGKLIFVSYNSKVFSNQSLLDILHALAWGLKFDLAISAMFSLLAYMSAYLAKRLLKLSFKNLLQKLTFVAATVLIILHGADLIYYEEAGRHLGYELRETLNSGSGVMKTALQTYPIPSLLHILLLLPIFFVIKKIFSFEARIVTATKQHTHTRWFYLEAQLLITLVIAVIIIRGGLQHIPLAPLNAQEIGESDKATIALNGVYNTLYSSLARDSFKSVFNTVPSDEQKNIVRNMYKYAAKTEPDQSVAPYNVVIIFLEAWSSAFMGSYGYEKNITPYFDYLRTQSLTTADMLAGGHRTTEGIFTTLCSSQNPLGRTVAQTYLQNYKYECLPKILRQQGYSNSFFQGSLENTSGTGAFTRLLGFEESYGKEHIKNRQYEENSWGVHDPDLYNFATEKMLNLPQPFFVGINTNSTHDSVVPESYKSKLQHQDKTSNINSMPFADDALKIFIESYLNNDSFGKTIFVLVADHTGGTHTSMIDKYRIPFLIYAPDIIAPKKIEQVVSQRDIAPTVLDLLNISNVDWFTGKSLLRDDSFFADYYHAGFMGWVSGNVQVEFPITSPNKARCRHYGRTNINWDSHCKNSDIVNRALAFTHVSQDLLFSGKTKEFSQLRK